MTIREFWHDIRERLSDDHRPRPEWRDERGPDWDRDRWQRSMRDNRDIADERRKQGERVYGDRDRSSQDDWSSRRFFRNMTSASYDPGVFTGGTWSADERSTDWRERQIDDYGLYAAGYTELGWPDRYSSTLYGVGYRGRGPQNWQRLDNRIREDVCELMTEVHDLDPSDIEVQVKDGEVTLTGTVENRRDKRYAEELAEQVSGVRDVHNRLQVHRGRDTFLGTRDALAGSSMGTTPKQ